MGKFCEILRNIWIYDKIQKVDWSRGLPEYRRKGRGVQGSADAPDNLGNAEDTWKEKCTLQKGEQL